MKEEWKTIPLEPSYEVSTLGRVRNKETKHVKSLRYDRSGYLRVTLYPSGKTYSAHKLVGRTWLSDTFKEGLQIDHLNAVRDDNRVENLEWVTLLENQRRIKNRPCKVGSNNDAAVIDEEIAFEIKYTFTESNIKIAKRLGLTRSVVEHVRRRERWLHVVDEALEGKWSKGELRYDREPCTNLDPDIKEKLIQEVKEDKLVTKEIASKFNVSTATVCRYKRKYLKENQNETN